MTASGGVVANAQVDNSVVVGFNDNNTANQAANVGPGSTGLELAIPLSLLGNPDERRNESCPVFQDRVDSVKMPVTG